MRASEFPALKLLDDEWDEAVAARLDEAELLRYRSNLLGADLRITNFGGGNTSSKIEELDPLTGEPVTVLWVKGSGGDLGSIRREGFATLYQEKLLAMESRYEGVAREDAMVGLYPLAAFRANPVAASIDTPLHGFLPFRHVDHLHPDWAIALAASANGRAKMEAFNERFGHRLAWVPWQRPGFELAMMMRRAVEETPGCDGVVLGGHGLFTWGETQRECYWQTISVIDQLGQFIEEHRARMDGSAVGGVFGGVKVAVREDREAMAQALLPVLRGRLGVTRRVIGHYSGQEDVLEFVGSEHAERLAWLGTSCPDHFIRTKIRPLFVSADGGDGVAALTHEIDVALERYRAEYAAYYQAQAGLDSPPMREANPTVVLVAGVGMFSFGKTKTEARIAGEFYRNAVHVMAGAEALGAGGEASSESVANAVAQPVPQAGPAAQASEFTVFANYVALPLKEAFGIEYWALEEAKLRRQPAEKEWSRRVVMVVGGGSGIGREVAVKAAARGAHVVVADRDVAGAEETAGLCRRAASAEAVMVVAVDITRRASIEAAVGAAVAGFGGVDAVVNTAALFPSSPDGVIDEGQWARTLEVNVTANWLLAEACGRHFRAQNLPATMVLTSSANAVVAKRGSEAYDVSKAAVSHLVRELAVGMAPLVRVNGVSPATVVKGSMMFPRDRVKASLTKYGIGFAETMGDEELRALLAAFYAQRTLTHVPIDPGDCAEAILFLAGEKAPCTTGHLMPVDGGLEEAFLR